MSLLSDDIVKYFQDSGFIDGMTIQFGEMIEGSDPRYFVIMPDNGPIAMPWIRSPRYRVILMGEKSKSLYGQQGRVGEVANNLVEYVRDNASSSEHCFIEITEPQPLARTNSDRAVVQLVVTTKS